MVTNQSKKAMATAGNQPTFAAIVMVKQHPHEEQSSFGRHRGVYHGATTGITTLIRSLRVLLSSRSERNHSATSVASVATHSPLREYSFSPSLASVATHSPLRECISPLHHPLRVLAFPRSERHHSATSVASVATHSPLREYSFSPSLASVATHSPLRECISPLGHTLRSPLLLRSLRPPSLLVLVLQRLAFSPLCSPGNCSFVTSCQGCIESAGAASLSSSA